MKSIIEFSKGIFFLLPTHHHIFFIHLPLLTLTVIICYLASFRTINVRDWNEVQISQLQHDGDDFEHRKDLIAGKAQTFE